MIIIKRLDFDYWFSYGDNNSIDFTKNTLTQIKGINGSGKSSIALVLQEVFYGKNCKNIKKANLKNREFPKETLYAKVYFSVDDDNYQLTLKRPGSSIKLVLTKNEEDISSHTSTGTYKTIEEVLKLDFKTFSQLTYQSSVSNLQFLTATDSVRKAFLVSLFSLDKYMELFNVFKEASKKSKQEYDEKSGALELLIKQVSDLEKVNLTYKVEQEVPENVTQELIKLDNKLDNIKVQNKKITDNSQYIELLNNIDMDAVMNPGSRVYINEKTVQHNILLKEKTDRILLDRRELSRLNKQLAEQVNKSKKVSCEVCGQPWPEKVKPEVIEKTKFLVAAKEVVISDVEKEIKSLKKRISEIIDEATVLNDKFWYRDKQRREFETLSQSIDYKLPTKLIDKDDIVHDIGILKNTLTIRDDILVRNAEIVKHNNQIDYVKNNLKSTKIQILNVRKESIQLYNQTNRLDILKDAFSSNGLIAYKLEYLVKDLELGINEYLGIFSNGRFNIQFNLNKDKLDINIIDNEKTITVDALSQGEYNRVNISVLLAIRKMMAMISSVQINFLFLDEISGTLDEEGKETLIDILMKEDLNTLLVSHEYSHPLIPVINISKENGVSEIE